jgi:hypothetical protein
MPRRNRQRSWLDFDMRALTIIIGMPRCGFRRSARPEFAFAPDGEVGAPMVEERRHEGAGVQRDVLVNGAFGQAFGHDTGGGHGAGRHKDGEISAFFEDAPDQFQ